MQIDLFTDASVCHDSGIAGWGCVSKSDRGVSETSGVFKSPIKDVGTAELAALANGIFIALSQGVAKPGDVITANVDSTYVVAIIQGRSTKFLRSPKEVNRERREVMNMIDALISVYDVTLRARHVKAHASVDKGGHAANHIADRLARKNMRQARRETLS